MIYFLTLLWFWFFYLKKNYIHIFSYLTFYITTTQWNYAKVFENKEIDLLNDIEFQNAKNYMLILLTTTIWDELLIF